MKIIIFLFAIILILYSIIILENLPKKNFNYDIKQNHKEKKCDLKFYYQLQKLTINFF